MPIVWRRFSYRGKQCELSIFVEPGCQPHGYCCYSPYGCWIELFLPRKKPSGFAAWVLAHEIGHCEPVPHVALPAFRWSGRIISPQLTRVSWCGRLISSQVEASAQYHAERLLPLACRLLGVCLRNAVAAEPEWRQWCNALLNRRFYHWRSKHIQKRKRFDHSTRRKLLCNRRGKLV